MGMNQKQMIQLAAYIAEAVVNALKDNGLVVNTNPSSLEQPKMKSAYAKTEALLFNYKSFQKVVEEREQDIEDIRKHGVPESSVLNGLERVQTSRTVHGIVLPQDAVEHAVQTVQSTVQQTSRVIKLIDKALEDLEDDPYYDVIPMRYFEGRTLEDIGVYFGVDHSTISRNKSRLVKELAVRLFPDEMALEMMQ